MNINPDYKGAARKLMGGKTKQRSQLCTIGTEDGRLVDVEYEVLRACAVDIQTESAYVLDAFNQVRDRRDGKWYQLLGERSTLPICLIKETDVKDLEALIEDIYKDAKSAAISRKFREAKQNKNWDRFVMLTSMFAITALVLVFMRGC